MRPEATSAWGLKLPILSCRARSSGRFSMRYVVFLFPDVMLIVFCSCDGRRGEKGERKKSHANDFSFFFWSGLAISDRRCPPPRAEYIMYRHILIFICICIHMSMSMYMNIYVYMYVCMYIYMYMHMYMYIYIYTHTHTHTHAHTHARTHTHTHTHTYIYICILYIIYINVLCIGEGSIFTVFCFTYSDFCHLFISP
jgi:hypothetical protein